MCSHLAGNWYKCKDRCGETAGTKTSLGPGEDLMKTEELMAAVRWSSPMQKSVRHAPLRLFGFNIFHWLFTAVRF